jgi:FkbM family methyltransferase
MQINLEQYEQIQPVTKVKHGGQTMRFTVPNRMTHWRVQTLFSKEPCTIEWLDSFQPGEELLDVGANIGLYTVYAAMVRGCQVTAFEPESQNYALLNRNIHLNQLSDRVTAYCAAAMDQIKLDRLFLSKFDFHGGGSCHSFGAEVGFDLAKRASPFAQGCISIDIDQAVDNRMLAVPDHIKIDVDGFEHKVVAGAAKTLQDRKVRSLLIEVNPHLQEHRALMDYLAELGFSYDPQQFQRVARTEGAFEGVGEIIFRRGTPARVRVTHTQKPAFLQAAGSAAPSAPTAPSATAHNPHAGVMDEVLARIRACPVLADPFPHAVIDGVFPPAYYALMQEHFPTDATLTPLSETGRTTGYDERLVALFNEAHFARLAPAAKDFWVGLADWLYDERFMDAVIEHFGDAVAPRLAHLAQRGPVSIQGDALLVSDKTRYAIGPHTDAAHRLITFLFYLPADDRHRALGTSIYRPKDPGFRCAGGPHHVFERFERLRTVEFLPNRLFMFARTDQSFHGVEPITEAVVDRHLLINNIRLMA